jgi:hypothetical protein
VLAAAFHAVGPVDVGVHQCQRRVDVAGVEHLVGAADQRFVIGGRQNTRRFATAVSNNDTAAAQNIRRFATAVSNNATAAAQNTRRFATAVSNNATAAACMARL